MSNGEDANQVLIRQYDDAISQVRGSDLAGTCPAHAPLVNIVVVIAQDMRARRARERDNSRAARIALINNLIRWAVIIGIAALAAYLF